MSRNDGIVYMLSFCLLIALVLLLKGTPPPQKVARISNDNLSKKPRQQELNTKYSK